MRLEGRVALVTGGSRGIGRAISLAVAAEGAAVGVNYRSGREQAQDVVAEIERSGGQAIAIQGDVADYATAEASVQRTVAELGGLHILVNNAGIAKNALIANMEPGDWLDVMRVNFGGVFNFTKASLTHFMRQQEGVIVNVSSVMGERGWTGDSSYAASKGAINAFTRCCAMEVGRFGVRVNAVLPGFVTTEMVSSLLDKDAGKGLRKAIPLRTFADADDVAQAVVFPASSDADYMTGTLLTVDGGASAMLGLGRQPVER
jgi:3-oxoacyl-[acyl-carrier protein] reductase